MVNLFATVNNCLCQELTEYIVCHYGNQIFTVF